MYDRETMMHLCCDAFPTTHTLPPHPLQCLGQQLAAKAMRLLLRKLTDDEVRLLLASARSTEGYAQDLHLCATGARVPRPALHLAMARLRHRFGQGDPDPKDPRPLL
jgi:hypothetical protein